MKTLRFSISRIMQVIAIAVVFAVSAPQMSATTTEGRPGANEHSRSQQDNRSRGTDRGRTNPQTARPTQGGASQGQRPKATNNPQQNHQRQSAIQGQATQNRASQMRPAQSQSRPAQMQNRPTQAQPTQGQNRPSQGHGTQPQTRPSSQDRPSQSQAQPQGTVPGQRPGANIGSSNGPSSNQPSQRPGNGNNGNKPSANQPGNGGNGGFGGNRPGNNPGGNPGQNWGNNQGHNPGGPGHNPGGPGHNPGGPGHGPGGPGHNWGGHGPGGPGMGIPPRPHMPAPRPFAVPPRPHSWRPIGPMPTFTTILGMALGMTLDATLNYLYTGGYNILGYNNSMVYLSNVMMLNLPWPDATLYYTPSGLLQASEFVYSTMYPDYSRYNLAYNSLIRSYGAPVSMTNSNGGMTVTWFGNGNRFVTLSYMPQYSAGGILQYYTTLSFGI